VYLFHQTANVQLGYAFLVIFALFLFTFSFGVGPMAWFLATELSVSADRSLVQSLSVSCQYLTCFISPLLFFPLYHSPVGVLSFLIFIFPLLFTTGYLWVRLPETRGRSISEIVGKLGDVQRQAGVTNQICPCRGKDSLNERF
jgi:SP family facilitated glucose transporter-like MFS transporter 8